ncbi:MAG: acylphosphatase [Actinomycetes bacterium]
MLRRRVVVGGHVQGVFFRDSCRRQAQARGVAGWVRNNDDGTVEAVFEGARREVEAMVAWMRQGPRSARVETSTVSIEEPEQLQGFRVTSAR